MIVALDAAAMEGGLDDLADVLVDCVEGGASVSFMLPFPRSDALAFWRRQLAQVTAGEVIQFAAVNETGRIDGTVQLRTAMPPNQLHRADIAKMLVHRRARRRGLARGLMLAAEAAARQRGLRLLVLDTIVDSPAASLYQKLGFTKAGIIPDYARMPDVPLAATAYYWKQL
jgi:ribosomal protein S18 acetylase RimI-like enzyme